MLSSCNRPCTYYSDVKLSVDDEEEEEEGEDLEEHWLDDYVAQPELDTYDRDVLDEEEYEAMTREQREAAEKAMEEREARGDSGDRQAVAEDMRDDRFAGLEDDDDEYDEVTGERIEGDVNLEAFDVPLREWIAQGRTRIAIKRRCHLNFITLRCYGFMCLLVFGND